GGVRPDRRAPPYPCPHEDPIVFGGEPSLLVDRARLLVVDEHHAVPHEDFVLDHDSVTDERVALDLAALADHSTTLALDERADPSPGTDPATVEIGERVDGHVFAELDVGDQTIWRVVRGCRRHRPRRLSLRARNRAQWIEATGLVQTAERGLNLRALRLDPC